MYVSLSNLTAARMSTRFRGSTALTEQSCLKNWSAKRQFAQFRGGNSRWHVQGWFFIGIQAKSYARLLSWIPAGNHRGRNQAGRSNHVFGGRYVGGGACQPKKIAMAVSMHDPGSPYVTLVLPRIATLPAPEQVAVVVGTTMVEVAKAAMERKFRVPLWSDYKVLFLHIGISPRLRVPKVTRVPVLARTPFGRLVERVSQMCGTHCVSRNEFAMPCMPSYALHLHERIITLFL